ncbi:MAG: hypothetical protein LBS57_03260 [Treponema sp.]|jgi:hypothetical protein|nr:hypothetical protein [Treponema sp.]
MTKKTAKPATEKNEKIIVLSFYGKGEAVTELSINMFTPAAAKKHCQNINALELKGGKWVHAAIVEESDKIIIKKPPTAGKDITLLNHLDDRSIQKLLHKLDALTLCLALKNAPKAIQDRVLKNMEKRHAVILKEDMDYMGAVKVSKVRAARNEIAVIVDTLDLNGEIEILDGNYR